MNYDNRKNNESKSDVEMSSEMMRLARECHRHGWEDEMTKMRMDAMKSAFGDEDPHMLSFDEIAEIMKHRRNNGKR